MTIREYISQKLTAFGLTEATFADMIISGKIFPDDEYSAVNAEDVGRAMVEIVGELIMMPKLSAINESGFSMTWDYGKLGSYYLWLCNKWGVTPQSEIIDKLGLSIVIDKSDCW